MNNFPRNPEYSAAQNDQWLFGHMTELRTGGEAALSRAAESRLQDFGLVGEYDVYADTTSVFGGGFSRFISKEDPSQVVYGIGWPHIGGSATDPDRSLHSVALYPNGDLVHRTIVENSRGVTEHEYRYVASSDDPQEQQQYARQLSILLAKAHEAIAMKIGNAQAKKGRVGAALSRLLGRG